MITAWCVKSFSGVLYEDEIRCKRITAITAFVYLAGKDWNYWRKRGYRCVKVEIREIEQKEVKHD